MAIKADPFRHRLTALGAPCRLLPGLMGTKTPAAGDRAGRTAELVRPHLAGRYAGRAPVAVLLELRTAAIVAAIDDIQRPESLLPAAMGADHRPAQAPAGHMDGQGDAWVLLEAEITGQRTVGAVGIMGLQPIRLTMKAAIPGAGCRAVGAGMHLAGGTGGDRIVQQGHQLDHVSPDTPGDCHRPGLDRHGLVPTEAHQLLQSLYLAVRGAQAAARCRPMFAVGLMLCPLATEHRLLTVGQGTAFLLPGTERIVYHTLFEQPGPLAAVALLKARMAPLATGPDMRPDLIPGA